MHLHQGQGEVGPGQVGVADPLAAPGLEGLAHGVGAGLGHVQDQGQVPGEVEAAPAGGLGDVGWGEPCSCRGLGIPREHPPAGAGHGLSRRHPPSPTPGLQ